MKKKTVLIALLALGGVLILLLGIAAYAEWAGFPYQKDFTLSKIAAGENEPGEERVLTLKGRMEYHVLSGRPQRFVGTASVRGLYEPLSPPTLYASLYDDGSGTVAGGAFSDLPFPFQPVFYWDKETGLLLLPAEEEYAPREMTFYVTGRHTRDDVLGTWFRNS